MTIHLSSKAERYLVHGLLFLCLIYLVCLSWQKFGSLIIDSFRDIRAAELVLQGKAPYRDFNYDYGFITPYILAAIGNIFGFHLHVFHLLGAMIAGITLFFITELTHRFAGTVPALMAGISFLFVFAFGCYRYDAIFNFIFPYSYAAILFIMFLMAGLYHFALFSETGRLGNLAYWAAAFTMLFFCRIDQAIPPYAVFAVCGVVWLIGRQSVITGTSRKPVGLLLLAPLILSAAGYIFFLLITGGGPGFKKSVFDIITATSAGTYQQSLTGFYAWKENSFFMAKSFLIQLGGILLLALLCIPPAVKSKGLTTTLRIGSAVLIATLFYTIWKMTENQEIQYRGLPLMLIAGAIFLLAQWRNQTSPGKTIAILSIYGVGLAALARIPLAVSPAAHGFALAAPAIAASFIIAVLFLEPFQRRFPAYPLSLARGLIALLLCISIPWYWNATLSMFAQRNYPIATPIGEILCVRDKISMRILEAADFIRKASTPTDTVVAIPECTVLNTLTERKNPLWHNAFASEVFLITGESSIIREFESASIDYIVFAGHPSYGHDHLYLGKDYALTFHNWLLSHYDMVRQFGPYPFSVPDEFGIAVYKRKSLPSHSNLNHNPDQ